MPNGKLKQLKTPNSDFKASSMRLLKTTLISTTFLFMELLVWINFQGNSWANGMKKIM
jgi:hypothetical protein